MKKVSILTPTYNHEEYIGQCIESVLAQSYTEWEQIIIDDGSIDATRDVIKKYQDERIHYHFQANKGILRLGETYNRALNLADGELIAILEGDDYWPPDKLEILVPAFENPDVILAYGFARLVTARGEEEQMTIPSSQFLKRFPRSALFNDPVGTAARVMARSDARTYTFPCSVIVRAEALKNIEGFQSVPSLPFIDYPTFLTLSLRGKYFFVPRIMGYWRQHSRSNTQTRDEESTNSILRDFALGFLDANQAVLAVLPSERHIIEQTWRYSSAVDAYMQGRKFLVTKQYQRARSQFKKAFKTERRLKRRIAAFVGYCASWFHSDIELYYSITKRGPNLKHTLLPMREKKTK